jgi:ferritin-like metal-binding protein YciE
LWTIRSIHHAELFRVDWRSGVTLDRNWSDENMQEKTLDKLFRETLKSVYYAEQKILKALPKMAEGTASPELKSALKKHRDETETHIKRLQQIFGIFGERPKGKVREAIEVIIAEGEEILRELNGHPPLDAGLISWARTVEHYEIAQYGTLARWAVELGLKDAVPILLQTLEEEVAMDYALTKLAERGINGKAKIATS